MDLKVGLRSGDTLTFRLPDEIEVWQEREESLQAQITSLGLVHEGRYHALPAPSAFRRVQYMVEARLNGGGVPAAFRCGYVADDVTTWMTVYTKGTPPMVRVDVRRTGKLRWRP